MKRNILLSLIMIVLLISIITDNMSAGENDPHTIYGIISDGKGFEISEAVITIRNLNTNEINTIGNDTITGSPIPVRTDSNGKYSFDLLNLKSGYRIGDEIEVTAEKNNEIKSKTVTVESGNWGTKVEITLGASDIDGKDQWYDSISTFWLLLIILILIGFILILAVKKGNRSKGTETKITEPKKKLPPPPSKFRTQNDVSIQEEEDELPPPDDEDPPPPDDEI